jgi:hypothetical protein
MAVLALALTGAPASEAWAAKHKKPAKAWPAKKSSKPSEKKAAPEKSDEADEAPAAAASNDDADEEDAKPAPKAEPKKTASKPKMKMDDDEDESSEKEARNDKRSSDEDESSSDDEENEAPVVRKKAKKHGAEPVSGEAAVAFQLDVGSRGVHRNFDFNDPRFYQNTVPPGKYELMAAPVPFVHLGLYPLAFADRGGIANLGIVGRYERMIGTSSLDKATNKTSTSSGQEWDVGVRWRLPLGGGELGLSGTYGQQSFRLQAADLAPGPNSTVPNVVYTFIRADADGSVLAGPITIGAHVGTRVVPDTGPLAKQWFGTTKTTSIEAGLSLAYGVTPTFQVVAGADFLRYGFAFKPQTNSVIIAGGAVDQYISGYLALRLAIAGS